MAHWAAEMNRADPGACWGSFCLRSPGDGPAEFDRLGAGDRDLLIGNRFLMSPSWPIRKEVSWEEDPETLAFSEFISRPIPVELIKVSAYQLSVQLAGNLLRG